MHLGSHLSNARRLSSTICYSLYRLRLLEVDTRDANCLMWCVYVGKAGAGQQWASAAAAGVQPAQQTALPASKPSKERQPTKKRPVPQVSKSWGVTSAMLLVSCRCLCHASVCCCCVSTSYCQVSMYRRELCTGNTLRSPTQV